MTSEDSDQLSRRSILAGLPIALAPWQSGSSGTGSNSAAAGQPSIGNLFPTVEAYARTVEPRLSFLAEKGNDLERWKVSTRTRYLQILYYKPAPCDFAPKVIGTSKHDGYRQEDLSFQSAPSVWVPASLLIPDRPRKGNPAVVLLHDHGGFYYFGKGKMLELSSEPAVLTKFRKDLYPAGPTGPALARAGYVVLTIDAFYFGERRLDPASLPPEKIKDFSNLRPGSDAFIVASNKLGHEYESLTAKTIFMGGMTWPGILLWDDMRSVDYLLTRREVNPDRIGCLGLSLGGFRSTHLAAFHPRIRSGIICCFMSSYPPMLRSDVEHHTWMAYVPGAAELIDLPDVASLTAPNWLLVQYGRQDRLFPMEGKQQSADKIKKVYEKAGFPERMEGKFYDAPHMFSTEMHTDALSWFEKTLA